MQLLNCAAVGQPAAACRDLARRMASFHSQLLGRCAGAGRSIGQMRRISAMSILCALMVGCTSSVIVPGGQLRTASVAYQIDDSGAGDSVSVILCHRFAEPTCVMSKALELSADELSNWMKDAELRVARLEEQQRWREVRPPADPHDAPSP
jgi:hypothetical protein